MSANARLVITNGTDENTASLMVSISGANLLEWFPKSPPPASQIWGSSPYQDGKHLVSKTYDNVIDTFTVDISALSQDNTIHHLRKFIDLLERAVAYWTEEHNTDKYWLEVRGECETNIRYAIVVDYSIPETTNPFEQPFGGQPSTLEELQISIEHTIWVDDLSVGANCIALSDGVYQSVISGTEIAYPTAATDDASGNSVSFSTTSNLSLGDTGGSAPSLDAGIRFRTVDIPQYATILSASLVVTFIDNPGPSRESIQANFIVYGENNSTPAVFSTHANLVGRSRTSAQSAFGLWNGNEGDVITLNLNPLIIEQIVGRADWVSGNNLALILISGSTTWDSSFLFASWDHLTYPAPKLTVTWQTDSGVYHGQFTPTCSFGVGAAPYWRPQLITHIYWKDVSAVVFSSNLVTTAHPADYNLFQSPTDPNDELYVGIAVPADPNEVSPFNNLVFNLAAGPLTSVERHYWNGAWINMGAVTLFNLGGGIHYDAWHLPSDATTTTVNGVNAYWIKYVNQIVGTVPKQVANTIPYTISWSNVRINSEQITGDMSALINMLLHPYLKTAQTYCVQDSILVCARKTSRNYDSTFLPYIPMNVAFSEFASGTYVALGAAGTDVQDFKSYHGRAIQFTAAAPGTGAIANIKLNAKTYAGRYRAFVRGYGAADLAVGECGLYLDFMTYTGIGFQTKPVYNVMGTAQHLLWDLGIISLPSDIIYEDNGVIEPTVLSNQVVLTYKATAAFTSVKVYDLVLMPVDEAHVKLEISFDVGSNLMTMMRPWKLVTTNPKIGSYAFQLFDRNGTPEQTIINWDGQVERQLKTDILGSFNLDHETEYDLYFFMYNLGNGNYKFDGIVAPILDKNQRYLLARGDE